MLKCPRRKGSSGKRWYGPKSERPLDVARHLAERVVKILALIYFLSVLLSLIYFFWSKETFKKMVRILPNYINQVFTRIRQLIAWYFLYYKNTHTMSIEPLLFAYLKWVIWKRFPDQSNLIVKDSTKTVMRTEGENAETPNLFLFFYYLETPNFNVWQSISHFLQRGHTFRNKLLSIVCSCWILFILHFIDHLKTLTYIYHWPKSKAAFTRKKKPEDKS